MKQKAVITAEPARMKVLRSLAKYQQQEQPQAEDSPVQSYKEVRHPYNVLE